MLIRPGKLSTSIVTSLPTDPGRRRLMQATAMTTAGILVPSVWAQASLSHPFLANLEGGELTSIDEDAWYLIREALLAGLNLVPVVGGLLSYLGALFIPGAGQSPEQRWRAYTDARISETVFRLIKADLDGLTNVARLYRNAVASKDMKVVLSQSISANTHFTAAVPRFQLQGERAALLPLFAIAATLHLALLRDMILRADELGITAAYRQQLIKQQVAAIRDYGAYVDREVNAIYSRIRAKPEGGLESNRPLSQLLERRTTLHLYVLDMRDTWKAFDAAKNTGKVEVVLNREIFTGLIGRWNGSGSVGGEFPDWKPPLAPLRRIEVTRRLVSNIEVAFLDGVKMEYTNGDALTSGNLADPSPALTLGKGERVSSVLTRYRTIQGLVSIEMTTSAAKKYKVQGRENNFDTKVTSSFARHQLSSIRVLGSGRASARYAAGTYVLGFQLIDRKAKAPSQALMERIGTTIAPHLLPWLKQ